MQMSFRHYLRFGVGAFVSASIILWVIDTGVHLFLWQETLLRHFIHGSLRDYLGLLVAESQIALAVAVATVVIGRLAPERRRLGDGDGLGGFYAGFGAALSAVVMLGAARLAWNFPPAKVPLAVLIALVLGAMVWLVLRRVTLRGAKNGWGIGEMMAVGIFPALIVAFGNQTVDYALSGMRRTAISGVSMLLVLAGAIIAYRTASHRLRAIMTWLPVGVAVTLVAGSVYRSSHYGSTGDVAAANARGDRPSIVLIVPRIECGSRQFLRLIEDGLCMFTLRIP